MDEFLRRAPRTLVAMVALIAGYFLIIAANPPRTVCDEQLDLFKQSQKSFLLNQGKTQRSMAAQLYELCKSENGPGGCFDLFLNLRKMVEDLDRIPKACRQAAGEDALVLAELGRQPRFARQWLIRYQDRVMMGKDAYHVKEYYTYFRVLETDDEYFDYYRKYHAHWKMYGLALPDSVLKKVYFKNALQVIPGIDKSLFPTD